MRGKIPFDPHIISYHIISFAGKLCEYLSDICNNLILCQMIVCQYFLHIIAIKEYIIYDLVLRRIKYIMHCNRCLDHSEVWFEMAFFTSSGPWIFSKYTKNSCYLFFPMIQPKFDFTSSIFSYLLSCLPKQRILKCDGHRHCVHHCGLHRCDDCYDDFRRYRNFAGCISLSLLHNEHLDCVPARL